RSGTNIQQLSSFGDRLKQASQAVQEVQLVDAFRLGNGGEVEALVPVQQLLAIVGKLGQLPVAEGHAELARPLAQCQVGYGSGLGGERLRNRNTSTMPATNPPMWANVATPPVSCVPSSPTPVKNWSTIHMPSTTNAGNRTKKMKITKMAVSTG